jgi:serine/threonine-protein kinase
VNFTGVSDLMDDIQRQDAAARVGTTLNGTWWLDALLGVGGMAAVYAATRADGTRGAVKLLHASKARDTDVRRRFMREGHIVRQIDHAGAGRVIDEGDGEDGVAFLVMELYEGETLEARTAHSGGKLPVEEVARAIDALLDVLAAAHAKGIIHRDIKPANLLLTRDGALKVLDYGVAAVRGSSTATATQAGNAIGTPCFMSPEQARGRSDLVGPRSDLWSVGATMFTLLSGKRVHDGTPSEIMAATFMTPARALASVAPHVPEAIAAVVDRALSLNASERWPDARAMQMALREACRR